MRTRDLAVFALIGLVAVLTACAQAPVAATPPPATSTPAAAVGPAASGTPRAANGTPGAFNAGTRVSGTVQSVDGGKVTLTDGSVVDTSAQTRVTRSEPITASGLQVGQYVAVTAQRQPDNTLLASQVVDFDIPPQGASTFQRPMTGGNLMTNATIDKVSGDTFTVGWDGGGANVKLAPDAKITKLVVGSLSDVKAGSAISAQEANGVAQSISLQ